MLVKRFLVGLTLMGAVSSQTFAFSGFYAGGNLGINWLRGNHKFMFAGRFDDKRISKVGAVLGIHGGYTTEIGSSKTLVGGELAFLKTTGRQSHNLQIAGGASQGRVSVQNGYSIALSAILGKLLNPKVMMYAKVGLDYAGFEMKYSGLTFPTVASQSFKKQAVSVLPGAGIKYAFTPNIVVGGEYQFLGTYKKFVPRNDGTAAYSFKPSVHRLMASVSYYFG